MTDGEYNRENEEEEIPLIVHGTFNVLLDASYVVLHTFFVV